jgi:hypothetical protein
MVALARPHLPTRRVAEVPIRNILAALLHSLVHGTTFRELEQLFDVSAAYLTRYQVSAFSAIVTGLSADGYGLSGVPSVRECEEQGAAWAAPGSSPSHQFLQKCIGCLAHLHVPVTVRDVSNTTDSSVWRSQQQLTSTNVLMVVRRDLTIAHAWIGAYGSTTNTQLVSQTDIGAVIPGTLCSASTTVCIAATVVAVCVSVCLFVWHVNSSCSPCMLCVTALRCFSKQPLVCSRWLLLPV